MRRRQRDTRAVYMFLALAVVLVIGSELVRHDGPRYVLLILEVSVLVTMAVGLRAYPWMQARQAKEPMNNTHRSHFISRG